MQKVAILVAVLLALGVSSWYFLNNDTAGDAAMQETETTERESAAEQDESFSGVGSIAELLGRGDSFVCEFRAEEQGNVSEGTAYVDGSAERYRMDAEFQGQSTEESGDFNAIVENDMMYWWGDTPEGRMGMQMRIPEDAESASTPDSFEGAPQAVSPDESVEYNCEPWRVDASVFTPPNDVEFTDMDAMMDEMMQGMPEGFEVPENMPMRR